MAEPGELIDGILDVAAVLEVAARRFPRERTGPRVPIPSHVRLLVLKRDHFRCDWCGSGAPGQLFHLDHIVPWSAGGSDDSTNLRILCPGCNENRSNYRTDATYSRRMPCAGMCMPCMGWDLTRADFDGEEVLQVFCGWGNHISWIPKEGERWGCTPV